MARSEEQNRLARERARELILESAIVLFAERGVSGASIAEITRRAGVAQGLVNYHFGGKEQLIAAVIDEWFDALFGLPTIEGTADERLALLIDTVIMATGYALPLQRAVLAMQLQPSTHRLFAEAEDHYVERATIAEESVRDMFRERGAADPEVEEIMLRSTLEGVLVKFAVYGDTFPLEDARRWMYRLYSLPDPAGRLPLAAPPRAGSIRLRAMGAVREPLS